MRGIPIARFGVLLGGLLFFGIALVVARPAQAQPLPTSSGCLDPWLAGDWAICEIGLNVSWETEDTMEGIAKQLYQACRRVGDAQLKCLNRARTKLKRAGKKGCKDFEGGERETCLGDLYEDLSFLSDVIEMFEDTLKDYCYEEAGYWFSEGPSNFCEEVVPAF